MIEEEELTKIEQELAEMDCTDGGEKHSWRFIKGNGEVQLYRCVWCRKEHLE